MCQRIKARSKSNAKQLNKKQKRGGGDLIYISSVSVQREDALTKRIGKVSGKSQVRVIELQVVKNCSPAKKGARQEKSEIFLG